MINILQSARKGNDHGEDHHFTVLMNCQSPIIDPGVGAQNYAAPLSPSEARGCN